MRLINVRTFEMEVFIGEDKPKYAILSHTWEKEEVTYQDMSRLASDYSNFISPRDRVRSMLGFKKIEFTCRQAVKDGYDWAWVDTCCIDKSSSAELTEAINSMWKWYQLSGVCYIYLSDLDGGRTWEPDMYWNNMGKCRWFTRGWTLQELIAPRQRKFFDANWTLFAHLEEHQGSYNEFLHKLDVITGIPWNVLSGKKELEDWSIATRMSWASRRDCTRVEDVAYSLLGLFGVHMPLIYGEGKKAFIRLQEEIIKEYDDDSIFAWSVSKDDPRALTMGSILAESPRDFKGSHAVWLGNLQSISRAEEPLTITSRGVRISVPNGYKLSHKAKSLLGVHQTWSSHYIAIPLSCMVVGKRDPQDGDSTIQGGELLRVAIVCLKMWREPKTFYRLNTTDNLTAVLLPTNELEPVAQQQIYIRKSAKPSKTARYQSLASLSVRTPEWFKMKPESDEGANTVPITRGGGGWGHQMFEKTAHLLEYEGPGNLAFRAYMFKFENFLDDGESESEEQCNEHWDPRKREKKRCIALFCGFRISEAPFARPVAACCLLVPLALGHLGTPPVGELMDWFRNEYAGCPEAWAPCPNATEEYGAETGEAGRERPQEEPRDEAAEQDKDREGTDVEPKDANKGPDDRKPGGPDDVRTTQFVTSCQIENAKGKVRATAVVKIELRQDLEPWPLGGLLHRYHVSVEKKVDPEVRIDTTVKLGKDEYGPTISVRNRVGLEYFSCDFGPLEWWMQGKDLRNYQRPKPQ